MASVIASAHVDVTTPATHEPQQPLLDAQATDVRPATSTSDKMDESNSSTADSASIKNNSSSDGVGDAKEDENRRGDEDPRTPTRDSFYGIAGQKPLPDQPLTSTAGGLAAVVRNHLNVVDDDVDMAEADADTVADEEASDNESATSESQKPKKKKGQRFFCTDFPPCQLSFTRSEHLARHIRKHTGERPFQCHCSRRFSRLDNLRQHAQTVHVNEEIPGDSLAATSTRFQRQVRTDRVRPTTGRPRTATMNSAQGTLHGRGHGRNLSTSSIASTTSSFSVNEDFRKRQPPLAMAADSNKRSAGVLDDYMHAPYDTSPRASHYHQPGSGMNTPTSQLYSFGGSGYGSGYASPSSVVSRSSQYNGPRHVRRLSVPSSSNPYQSNPYSTGQMTPTSMHGSVYSGAPSGYASPTSSVFSSQGRLENESEVEFRRRTWHPNTQSNYSQRPATSGLSYHQTPDEERPALSSQPAALTRLPGIESFDQIPPLPIRQPTSPYATDRSLDHALHQGLHRLDITANGPPTHESFWPRPELASIDRVPPIPQRGLPPLQHAPPASYMHHMSMPEQPTTPKRAKRQAWYGGPVGPSTQSSLQPFHPMHSRTSPEDSGSSDGVATPAIAQSQEHHPMIVNHGETHGSMPMAIDEKPNAFESTEKSTVPQDAQQKPALPVRADSGFHSYRPDSMQGAPPLPTASDAYAFRLQAGHDPATAKMSPHQSATQNPNDMGRLEALVAVATSETRANESRP